MHTRGVAQLGRALRSGRRGREFESRHPDSKLFLSSKEFLFLLQIRYLHRMIYGILLT